MFGKNEPTIAEWMAAFAAAERKRLIAELADLAACFHSGGEAAVAIRKRAAELRKQAKGE